MRDIFLQTRFSPVFLLVVLLISGCGAKLVNSDNATVPAVETATYWYHGASPAAFAWRGAQSNGEAADRIFTEFMPDEPTHLPGTTMISETSSDTGPVELVRVGEDRYFVGWIDNTNQSPRLRWKILSANEWAPIHEGESSDVEGYLVSDFAAAYHPEQSTILVALLMRPTLPDHSVTERDESHTYLECVDNRDRVSDCHLKYFAINADTGGTTDESQPVLNGPSRALSIATGADGFIVAVAESPRGYRDQGGNRVRIYPFDAAGVYQGGPGSFAITGKSDCADDPQSVVDQGDDLTSSVEKRESYFAKTVIAYDTHNNRYLVGYTTDCLNRWNVRSSYFRARWVQTADDGGWVVYGVAETDVLEPPFQIAVAASEPMLAYNETLHLYLAGYGVSEQKQTIERQMLFARLLGEDVITMTPPFEVLEDKKDIFGGNYPTFVTGDIVAEPEGGKFYLVWEQRNNNVPCVDPDWATPCDLDWNGAITTGESKVYVFYFDFVPSN